MPDFLGPLGSPNAPLQTSPELLIPQYNEAKLLEMFERYKKESFDYRWIWEREWLRDIYYTINRQWIYYHPVRREWVDKRLQKSVPRIVTNKMAEVLQAIRATFSSINLGIKARPIGHTSESIATAEIVDQIAPLLHEEHKMNQVLRESDFWLIVTGNAGIQISWDTDKRYNKVFIPHEQCLNCQAVLPPQAIVDNNQLCPNCGSNQFQKALRPDGQAIGEWMGYGRGKTTALSPFEYAFSLNYNRFDELPYIIRLRWRDKHYYEANHPDIVGKLVWEKTPQDRSLQILKSLALTNDVGQGTMATVTGVGPHSVEGVTEYEIWIRPTTEFPEGFVMRVVGDRSPLLLTAQEEGLPGPIPFKDIEGNPLFPFGHAVYEHVGGRLYGKSALSPLIQKQDQINQLDSLVHMHLQRMANPVWIIPEGAGIDHFTGDPGLVVKYNPLAAGGNAKPERIDGIPISPTLFQLRAQYLKDIEELAGTYDILKGTKPAGVEAFSALNLLVERSQARLATTFASRGELYRTWFSIAIELERQFGPQQRVMAVVGPNRGYTFQKFENAKLQGNVSIHIEDGTQEPKTALGKRASIEHANQLGLLNPADPDQKYAIMSQLGLSDLIPSLDTHVQAALELQDAFERWLETPMGPHPLMIKPWHDLFIHYNERIKWLNTDHMRGLLRTNPLAEQLIIAHLQEMKMMLMPPMPVEGEQPQEGGVGAGRSMQNSNFNAGSPTMSPAPNSEPQALPVR